MAAPRVAVAGLNPHAGEGGLFGDEEARIILPAIEAARREGIDASGPWPGDTVFMQARQGRFDVVVAQYHDQGLIPVKYLGLDQGVNITLGLPFVRTSPDHGTAFDIAGQGKADPASLQTAIDYAFRLAAHSRTRRHEPSRFHLHADAQRPHRRGSRRVSGNRAGGRRAPHWLQDIGQPVEELARLNQRIKAAGASSYLEVVSQDLDSELTSVRVALDLGVDYLLGGTHVDEVLPLLAGSRIRYYPFPGEVYGHPSILGGTLEEIVASARRIGALPGVHGLDLLAYRASVDVPMLMAEVCRQADVPVIMAGSIDTTARIQIVRDAGAAGFTVGTAALDERFPAQARLLAQLKTILAAAS